MLNHAGEFKYIQLFCESGDGQVARVMKRASSIAARVFALRNSASSDFDVTPKIVPSSVGSGSSSSNAAACVDRDTVRFVPFFVCASVATRPLTSAGIKLQISPARIAVSIANRNAMPTRWVIVSTGSTWSTAMPSVTHKRSISSSCWRPGQLLPFLHGAAEHVR